jgi:hypothetical protein
MPEKKVVPVRFYPGSDADLIEWLKGLTKGDGNDCIKAMLRAGIAASQNRSEQSTPPGSITPVATLDSSNLQAALDSFLPRIREIVDASLASVNFTAAASEIALQDENIASDDLLKGHLIGDDEDD